MSKKDFRVFVIPTFFLILCFVSLSGRVMAQGAAFSYQGKLTEGGLAANGAYDFRFRLFGPLTGGAQIGADVLRGDVDVAAGVFTTTLDFGTSPFTGATAFHLEIAVRPGASTGAYTPLNPRQPLTSSPYAIQTLRAVLADAATTANNALNLGGIPANQYLTTTSGGGSFIQNQSSGPQTGNFNISGNGNAAVFDATTSFNLEGFKFLSKGPALNPNTVLLGFGAGTGITTGTSNVLLGVSSGNLITTGSRNTQVGVSTLISGPARVGSDNTMIGYSTSTSASAAQNTLVGSETDGTGDRSTAIGYNAKAGLGSTVSNSTAIGANATVERSDSIVIGSINGINGATVTTNVGIGTNIPKSRLNVAGNIFIENNPNSLIIQAAKWYLLENCSRKYDGCSVYDAYYLSELRRNGS